MNYGVTPQGFIRKNYQDILDEMQTSARSEEFFGENVDLSDNNILGAELKLMATALSQLWELAEKVYYSVDLYSAEGSALSRLVNLNLVARKGEIKAVCDLEFSGDEGAVVPVGTQVETAQNIVFSTLSDCVLLSSGKGFVQAQCITAGTDGNVPPNSITTIKNPITGVDSVTNTTAGSGGRGVESDLELVERYENSFNVGGAALSSIVAAIKKIEEVSFVFGTENEEMYEQNGLPAKSIYIVVEGGANEDIASTIFEHKSGGIKTAGNIEINVSDSQGMSHVVRFSRPEIVSVFVRFVIVTNANYNPESDQIIKGRAVSMILGLSLGASIYGWKLSAAAADISGIESIDCFLGLTPGNTTSSKITLEAAQRAYIEPSGVIIE